MAFFVFAACTTTSAATPNGDSGAHDSDVASEDSEDGDTGTGLGGGSDVLCHPATTDSVAVDDLPEGIGPVLSSGARVGTASFWDDHDVAARAELEVLGALHTHSRPMPDVDPGRCPDAWHLDVSLRLVLDGVLDVTTRHPVPAAPQATLAGDIPVAAWTGEVTFPAPLGPAPTEAVLHVRWGVDGDLSGNATVGAVDRAGPDTGTEPTRIFTLAP